MMGIVSVCISGTGRTVAMFYYTASKYMKDV